MSEILKVKDIQKIYSTNKNKYKAIDNINLTIDEGDFIGIMGPSGAGKSSLLNMISTIDTPTSGEIYIDGQNILRMNENQLSNFRRNKLGFIFQDFNLLDTLTVRENIALPLVLSKKKVKIINSRVSEIAEKLGISHLLDKYPLDISGGEKQRTAAARAIITNPSLILADEPTGALDSKSSTELLKMLAKVNNENKATIMMVTHDAFAASFAKKVIFIKDGKLKVEIKKDGSREEFFERILEELSKLGGNE
ncbi:MAG: ABC transporter ATP-binding protein [Clostridioides sp.]|jgi:putative ABC transport system ATP-binding protein|nr:ABC transporter ATP-binding protein [Clostridioides sp.]